jgi:hypothetical protein
MHMDAVIGCDAVDAGAEWLRLKTAAGAVRTIPWSTIKIAGMGGNHDGNMEIQGVTEKATPFFGTHDSLWIVCTDGGIAQVMIEKASPKREAILDAFAKYLGIGWRGDELTTSELTNALFQMPVSASKGLPKIVSVMMAVMAFLILAAIVVGYLVHRN